MVSCPTCSNQMSYVITGRFICWKPDCDNSIMYYIDAYSLSVWCVITIIPVPLQIRVLGHFDTYEEAARASKMKAFL